jgi:hypothetical protein
MEKIQASEGDLSEDGREEDEPKEMCDNKANDVVKSDFCFVL